MANMAVSRIKREFKEVIKSEEVSKYIWLKLRSSKSDIKYVINTAYGSPSVDLMTDTIFGISEAIDSDYTIREKKIKITNIRAAHSGRLLCFDSVCIVHRTIHCI